MPRLHGHPVWFELTTAKGQLAQAEDFYARVLGWQIGDSGMEGMAYHLARAEDQLVAGLMEIPDEMDGMPPNWTLYLGAEDADATARDIRAAGGRIHVEPTDIPGTGRFAVASDPQGAAFGILAPLPMEGGGETRAFDQQKAGHGNWTELMSTDPVAGFDFYARVFGWRKSQAMDMGPMGTYQLFSHDGADIGGMMGLGNAPRPVWLVYFGVNGVDAATRRIRDGGGSVQHGPTEVPGGAHVAVATDPQGAWFAVVGPLEETP